MGFIGYISKSSSSKEYLELVEKYENSEFKSKLDELAETIKIYKPPATYKKGD